MAAVVMFGTMAVGCKNNAEAKKSVETFYGRLSSPDFKEDAISKGFKDWKVEKTDSDIVTRVTLPDDMHFSSKIASKNWVATQRLLTVDNYRRMCLTDSVVNNAFTGMNELGMNYKAVYYDNSGDSVMFVILPEEVVSIAR